ncbi:MULTISPECIES: hypothetical protein [unclassified Chryseobacterium]|uniref:hypothetical protein n=1 Tax=unclassified Chryseobacterium TaxID=2593645 RepID=UPI000956F451|nr:MULTISPECIES: hypothetical protein [unclassified Chryseobacterium]SIR72457.1 hypothetical protein SAMN05880573_13817 [Chryseobacterium sp. RU33C]
MPYKETEELHEHFEEEQTHLQENTDFLNENTNATDVPIEKNKEGKGLRFLNSIGESGSFIKKTLKPTAIGIVAGFALSLLFPPLGIAVMAISAIAGGAAIGAKVADSYAKTKDENNYTKENSETKDEVHREIMREQMEESLLKDKGNFEQQDKNKSSANTNESELAMYTKPLNVLNPNIIRETSALPPKAQQEKHSVNKNVGIRHNIL